MTTCAIHPKVFEEEMTDVVKKALTVDIAENGCKKENDDFFGPEPGAPFLEQHIDPLGSRTHELDISGFGYHAGMADAERILVAKSLEMECKKENDDFFQAEMDVSSLGLEINLPGFVIGELDIRVSRDDIPIILESTDYEECEESASDADAKSGLQKLREAMEKDEAFFFENRDYLMSNYKGEYVAIRDCEIVARSRNRREILETVRRIGRVYLELVEEESFRERPDWEDSFSLFREL